MAQFVIAGTISSCSRSGQDLTLGQYLSCPQIADPRTLLNLDPVHKYTLLQ